MSVLSSDKSLGDGQSEPATPSAAGEKRPSHPFHVLGRNAVATVTDDQRYGIGHFFRIQLDNAAVGRKLPHRLHCIEHQIEQHLAQLRLVAANRGTGQPRDDPKMDAHVFGLGTQKLADVVEHRVHPDRGQLRLVRSSIRQEIADQASQSSQFIASTGEGLPGSPTLGGKILIQKLEIEVDGVQGVADLMREVRGQSAESRHLLGFESLSFEPAGALDQKPHEGKGQ